MKLQLLALASTLVIGQESNTILNGEKTYHGLVTIREDSDMFYWLMPSRRSESEDPLVIWLTGGPGCASELATFYENGPTWIKDDMSFEHNEYSWNEHANVLYVDNPIGVGYSRLDSFNYDSNED